MINSTFLDDEHHEFTEQQKETENGEDLRLSDTLVKLKTVRDKIITEINQETSEALKKLTMASKEAENELNSASSRMYSDLKYSAEEIRKEFRKTTTKATEAVTAALTEAVKIMQLEEERIKQMMVRKIQFKNN